jgi:hypothetical protein
MSRSRRPQRKAHRGVSDFISHQLVALENFARVLNGEHGHYVTDASLARGVAVVEAALSSRYPAIPVAAADAFDALASGQPLEYTIRRRPLRARVIRLDHRTPMHLSSPTEDGPMVVWLATYFMSPERERLRRCQQCARWFVDLTRNKSARRCSSACTIAWSNAQRKGVANEQRPKRGGSR